MKLIRKIYLVSLLFCFSLPANAQKEKDILDGKWTNQDETAQIVFSHKEGKYHGSLTLLKNVNAKDKNNSDKKLRERNLNGIEIISGLTYSGGKYINGIIYSPERGQTANCNIEWVDKNTINIIGSKAFISKKQVWKR